MRIKAQNDASLVRLAATVGLIVMCGAAPSLAGDLRDITIGMRVTDLAPGEYRDASCVVDGTKLASPADYAKCRSSTTEGNLREIAFNFDWSQEPRARFNDQFEGTRIGGHPVKLSVLLTGAGVVEAIRVRTDPTVPYRLKKSAFLFGLQAMLRYGQDGWNCRQHPRGEGEEPVGGIYLNELCTKQTADRSYQLDRRLFLRKGSGLRDFTTESELLIAGPSVQISALPNVQNRTP